MRVQRLVLLGGLASLVGACKHDAGPFYPEARTSAFVRYINAVPDTGLLEAASDLGARPFTAFRRVVLPNSMPGVLAAALVVFVPTVGDYVTPAMVGGPASTMIGTLIQSQFGKANDWPFGAALSVCVMLVILVVVLVARNADRRFGSRT